MKLLRVLMNFASAGTGYFIKWKKVSASFRAPAFNYRRHTAPSDSQLSTSVVSRYGLVAFRLLLRLQNAAYLSGGCLRSTRDGQ